MKKILCPVDFSMHSEKVARYAAQLAHQTNSKVVLVAVHQVKPVLVGEEHDSPGDILNKLSEMHDMLKTDYQISCGMEEEIIDHQISRGVSLFADRYDFTILGAPADDVKTGFRNFSGIDVIKTIQDSLAPLLIVPSNYNYEPIKRLTYAYDYLHEPELPLTQLYWLASWFNAEIRFISILNNSSYEEEEKLNALERNIRKEWKSQVKISFDSVVYDDAAKCLDHYIKLWPENSLLVLTVNHKNFLEKIWHKSVIKKLIRTCKNPYMILHK